MTTLTGFGRRIPPAVRDELAQETVLRMLALVEVRKPLAMARRIAHNLAIDHLRRQRADPTCDADRLADTRWVEQVQARLDLERAVRALDGAPGAYRRLITAIVLEERGMDELIASEALGAGKPVARARQAVYRRRGRAFGWMRAHARR